MENLKVYIVDDEQKAIDTLSTALQTFFDDVEVIGSAASVEAASIALEKNPPDLLFLDIEMGKTSGFDLLERLETVNFAVVFVTAHEEFALKAIKFSALDYIIKPPSIKELKSVLTKVRNSASQTSGEQNRIKHMFGNFLSADKSSHKITLAVSEGYEFIEVDHIYYLRAEGSYTDFFLKNGDKLTTSKNLKFFESILEGYGFFRIHNSTMVNLKYIKRFNRTAGGSVVMQDDAEFSISKSRKEQFMQLLQLG
jgi:two-component system LytT family response regulator